MVRSSAIRFTVDLLNSPQWAELFMRPAEALLRLLTAVIWHAADRAASPTPVYLAVPDPEVGLASHLSMDRWSQGGTPPIVLKKVPSRARLWNQLKHNCVSTTARAAHFYFPVDPIFARYY